MGNRPQPYARVDFIPQSGTLDLAFIGLAEENFTSSLLYRIPIIRVFSYYVSLFLFSERNPSSGNKESSAFFGNNIETVRWCQTTEWLRFWETNIKVTVAQIRIHALKVDLTDLCIYCATGRAYTCSFWTYCTLDVPAVRYINPNS